MDLLPKHTYNYIITEKLLLTWVTLEAVTHLSNLTEQKRWDQAPNYLSLKGILL